MAPFTTSRALGAITQLLAFSSVCNAYPALVNDLRSRQIGIDDVADSYDYIIVGGGQSGVVIASRLSEDESKSVLVVEYGYFDNNPDQLEPSSAVNWPSKDMYNLTSAPLEHLSGNSGVVYAAAVVGGGSTINGMMLNRGSPEDYDNWGALGNPGWDWEGILPYFKKSSHFNPPADELAEEFNITWDLDAFDDGPIELMYAPYQWPGTKIQWDAMVEAGAEPQIEGSLNAYGVFWVPAAMDPATVTRSYAVSGYYNPAKDRSNLQVLTGTRVNEVLLDDDKRATGVTIQPRDTPDGESVTTVNSNTEIILCAGWLHTPQVLQRSGIGPASLLDEAGVEVLVELPGVGSNFQDHAATRSSFRYTTDVSPNPFSLYTNATFREWAETQWEENRSGPLAQTVGNTAGMIPLPLVTEDFQSIIDTVSAQEVTDYLPSSYTSESVEGFKAQRELLLASFASNTAAVLEVPFNGGGGSSLVVHKPLSRGTIFLNTTDKYAAPIVQYNTMSDPGDTLVAANFFRFIRKWMATDAMSQLGPEEETPGSDITETDELIEKAKGAMTPSTAHGCCTAAMQPQELGGVVSPELTVYGVQGLSVGDISIMPLIVASHTCSSVYAIAEKAADLIKERNS